MDIRSTGAAADAAAGGGAGETVTGAMADGDGDGGEAPAQASALWELLDLVDEAVVMCDRAGETVRGFNRAAARFFPRLRPGDRVSAAAAEPLARAAARGAERFEAAHAGRRLDGRRHTADGREVWLIREVGTAREVEAALRRERDRSAFLEETVRRMGASLHHGRSARTLVRIAQAKLADVALLVLPVTGRITSWYRAGPGDEHSSGQVSVETLERVPEIADALYGLRPRPAAVDPGELEALGALAPGGSVRGGSVRGGSDRGGDVRSGDALVLQLTGGGAPTGALVLLRGPGRARFDDVDVELAGSFAVRAGLALATAALYSQQAHTIGVLQAGLAPHPLPAVDGLRLGAAYRPAGEALRISGDFYHVAPRPDEGAAFFFGDVAGKGAEAAVLAGEVRQSMRTLARTAGGLDPVRDLELLNDIVMREEHGFTTLVTGSARPREDGSVLVEIADGGHLPPLVLRAGGGVEEIACGGTIVGAVHDPHFVRTEFRLAPGELMVLYSDGVTEARGGARGNEMFGDERLAEALGSCRGMQAAAVAERLELLTTEWLGGRPHDDIAVLVLQAPPRGGADEDEAGTR